MIKKEREYFRFVNSISCLIDILAINILAHFCPLLLQNPLIFHLYITISWIIISIKIDFYVVHSFTKATYILKIIIRQFVFLFLMLYAFIGFFKQPNISRLYLGLFFVFVFLLVTILKFLNHYLLRKYHEKVSLRNVVIIGDNRRTRQLIAVFEERPEYGYSFKKRFSPKNKEFSMMDCFAYIVNNNIDEIYCSVSELDNKQIGGFITFADNNIKTLKFLPDNKNIFSKKLKFEYYDFLPILSLRDIPLESSVNAFLKRSFDVIFAILVYTFLLSWLTPLIALLIYLDNPGPIYFKQNRPGYKGAGFYCYKFRTMKINSSTEVSASRDDDRVTKLGRFLRRTSLDELPQFINVLYGNMSVVGPRPHLWRQNEEYGEEIMKYMVRHYVKPGITGLAQSKGFRGGIETRDDIVNRIRYDVFYIENWSMVLDLKIIIQTVINVFKGEDNAY